MPLKKQLFPLRMPIERLTEIYSSVEEAFKKHDYNYVARYAQDDPELRGCALLMLGNRVGGELILNQYNIRTGLSFLYRAFAAWRAEDTKEAQRWIAEGRAEDGEDILINRLAGLIAKKSFNIVMHSRSLTFEHVKYLSDLPEINLILTSHAPSINSAKMLPIGDSLASMVPEGRKTDLVIVYDPWAVPPGAGDLGAPVIFVMNDGESTYDAMGEVLHEADLVATQSTSEMIECGQTYGVDCFTQYHFFPSQIEARGVYKRINDVAGRDVDLLFTGGLTQDFYRDKRQRIIPLAYELDPKFKIILHEGLLPTEAYQETLKRTRFAPVSTRFSNDLSSRALDLLAHGVINIIHEDSAMPFLFSKNFACFQTYRSDQARKDIEKHLYRYDAIQGELKLQLPQLEIELRDLLVPNKLRARRFLRDFLFMAHVIKPQSTPSRQNTPKRKTVVPFNQLHLAGYPREQLNRLISLTRPKGSGRAADWLRLALATGAQTFAEQKHILSIIKEGLTHHPKSVSILYSYALLLRNAGEYGEADKIFDRIATSTDLIAAPEDPFPSTWEPLQGFYWIADAKIRMRYPMEPSSDIMEGNVWKSFALSHRADIAIKDIPVLPNQPNNTKERFLHILGFAQQAIAYLPHNDAAQRAYLRVVYGMFALGDEAAGENFLRSFEAAIEIDGRLFNDFAAMAIDILSRTNRLAEAQRIKDKLNLFLERVYFGRTLFFLYPEIQPLLVRYGLPHGNLLRR